MFILLLICSVVTVALLYRSITLALQGIPHSNQDFDAFSADVPAHRPTANVLDANDHAQHFNRAAQANHHQPATSR